MGSGVYVLELCDLFDLLDLLGFTDPEFALIGGLYSNFSERPVLWRHSIFLPAGRFSLESGPRYHLLYCDHGDRNLSRHTSVLVGRFEGNLSLSSELLSG